MTGKGKQRALSLSGSESNASGSEAGDYAYERQYNGNGSASTSQQLLTSFEFDLPTLLHDLSLSRMPAPSVLSSVPDELLRCCGCTRIMQEFRYACTLCGPILPEDALSDDGTQRMDGGRDDNDGESANGTVVSFSTAEGEAVTLLQGEQVDPAGVALPLSPDCSPPTIMSQLGGAEPDPVAEMIEDSQHGYELCSECVETEVGSSS